MYSGDGLERNKNTLFERKMGGGHIDNGILCLDVIMAVTS